MVGKELITVKQAFNGIKVSYSWSWPGNKIAFAFFTIWAGTASLLFALLHRLSGFTTYTFAALALAVVGAAYMLYFLARLLYRIDMLVTAMEVEIRQQPFGIIARRSIPAVEARYIFSEASIFRMPDENPFWVSKRPPTVCHSLMLLLDGGRKVCLIPSIESSESARRLVDALHKTGLGHTLPPVALWEKTRPLNMMPVTGSADEAAPAQRLPMPALPRERIHPVIKSLSHGRLMLALLFAVFISVIAISTPLFGSSGVGLLIILILFGVILYQLIHLFRKRRIQSSYQHGSAVAMARVRERKKTYGSQKLHQRVRLEFMPTHASWRGGPVQIWANLSTEVYEELEEGQAVTVRYAIDNPRILLIDDEIVGTRLSKLYEARRS